MREPGKCREWWKGDGSKIVRWLFYKVTRDKESGLKHMSGNGYKAIVKDSNQSNWEALFPNREDLNSYIFFPGIAGLPKLIQGCK